MTTFRKAKTGLIISVAIPRSCLGYEGFLTHTQVRELIETGTVANVHPMTAEAIRRAGPTLAADVRKFIGA